MALSICFLSTGAVIANVQQEELTPLTDLGTSTYLGSQGGLYPEGANERPLEHESIGMQIALDQIKPLDLQGNPNLIEGKIVMASLGMSNTTQEFAHFVPLTEQDPDLNPNLQVVDTAQGGKTAFQWADPLEECWEEFENRLLSAGVSGKQLQVVWVKLAARKSELTQPAFPARAYQLTQKIYQSIKNLKEKYPSVRIVYLSSRIYAGYATTQLNPEPYAYESGFAVKWLIEKQIEGKPFLSYEGEAAPFPWLSWGPYLWANGMGTDNIEGGVPGRSDGLEWLPSDLLEDGTHPSEQGREKVAEMLLTHLKSDPTSIPWFLGTTGESSIDAAPVDSKPACGLVGLDAILFLSLLFFRSRFK